MIHTFHLPVLGLAFSIDTPIKIAPFGISSVISIVDDELIERMRKYYSEQNNIPFIAISSKEEDARARRITAYLDLVYDLVQQQVLDLKSADLETDENIKKYFELLPSSNPLSRIYKEYLTEENSVRKNHLAYTLKTSILPGDINVNIMSKVDKVNTDAKGNLLESKFSDAIAALRGFAMSKLHSSVILSAGMNPRLYSYLSELPQFLPNSKNQFIKKIILKVSDYRSALIQAKFLAKKGIWVSEFRVESGLNCGGHAFATEGYLLGPILEEFKQNRTVFQEELFSIYQKALQAREIIVNQIPRMLITAQGGIGNAVEHSFLLNYYKIDSTGWGSPFLLVPEATTLDQDTLDALASAEKDDFYVSNSSPLGVPFNNFKKSTAEKLRQERILKNRPGAPCTKKYLVTNQEYSEEPICTASRVYQYTKLKELELLDSDSLDYAQKISEITDKTCLCEGLATAAYLKYDILEHKEETAVAICPGPNTAYFNRIYSLKEMVDHIYGRTNLLENIERPSLFINELHLYIEHLEKYIQQHSLDLDEKKAKYINNFKAQLCKGIAYYKDLAATLFPQQGNSRRVFLEQLALAEKQINSSYISG